MSTPPNQANLNIPAALSRAQAHWNAGQADQAEMLCQQVLAAWPGQADALHLLGLMAHAYGNLDVAIAHLQQACMAPRAPAVYSSNLAEMYRQKGLLAEGEVAARRAVAMDPVQASGWNNLGILLQEAGKFAESRDCLERVIALQPDWAQAHNNLANTYRRLGHMDRAEQHYRLALSLHPDYAEAHSNLAFLLSAQGRYDEAASLARQAIELSPRLVDAYLNLADVEISRRRHEAALRVLDMLAAFAPQHPAALVARAKALRQVERFDEALGFARQAVALAPLNAEAHNTLATVLQSLGQTEEALAQFEEAAQLPGTVAEEALVGRAILFTEAGRNDEARAAFDRALAAFPSSVQALAGRADARTFRTGDPDIAALETCLAEGERRSLSDRISAHFALGKAYLDIQDRERAFRHLDAGNRHKRATFAYDAAATGRWMERIAGTFTPDLFARLHGVGNPSEMPVFIVGMPRSGTTLIEQIVSSHPQVTGAGELSALRLVTESVGGPFPDSVPAMTAEDLTRLGRAYLSRTAALAHGRARLVDKMPGNFAYAGLIPLILPGARIIHARRDPMDTCLSCYTKLFGGEQPFAYDQIELGRFYRDYERLMAHWRAVLPAACFIEVDYEAVVNDLDSEARRLVTFLGLPWDDACLNFHDNRRVVRTASVNQVLRRAKFGFQRSCSSRYQIG
ncbi:Beta-barrel assembly-enhancing protease [Paraburkholderia aspalathi]|uniref:Beta-barrel assembly-enhancing protease n=1 Tax=Paraburkholderia aspalathi TaxID=1324617 RepID=A0ABM8T8Z5_9BURK|nr:tetratricopeptide repeat-containing sulfotransferase family protein [Paraburkholderia aspalathi]MBK3824217.1 tetratricopeptide repeat protein [Paraburkholderia aspalathi]MBK3836061.1 tetratricopeptide repeat protein [Paraburkholderia aspalathi]CAE6868004.1 Beta-barrel assembly-enhancing protease [Paraburkholderia aspalathi]